jgi:hypothetical protein
MPIGLRSIFEKDVSSDSVGVKVIVGERVGVRVIYVAVAVLVGRGVLVGGLGVSVIVGDNVGVNAPRTSIS